MANNYPGIGVLISMLGGHADSVAAYKAALKKKITHVELDKAANDGSGELRFVFEDGVRLALYDGGQSCCESRYMTTDDDLSVHIGGKLKAVEIRAAPNVPSEEDHEVQFLVVKSTKGHSTVETHNEHNGYYGGFAIRVRDGW